MFYSSNLSDICVKRLKKCIFRKIWFLSGPNPHLKMWNLEFWRKVAFFPWISHGKCVLSMNYELKRGFMDFSRIRYAYHISLIGQRSPNTSPIGSNVKFTIFKRLLHPDRVVQRHENHISDWRFTSLELKTVEKNICHAAFFRLFVSRTHRPQI